MRKITGRGSNPVWAFSFFPSKRFAIFLYFVIIIIFLFPTVLFAVHALIIAHQGVGASPHC